MTKSFCNLPETEKFVQPWSDEVIRTQQPFLLGLLEGTQKELKDLGVVSGVVCPLLFAERPGHSDIALHEGRSKTELNQGKKT